MEADREDGPLSRRRPSLLVEGVEALLVALIFGLFVRTWLFQAFRIPSESMAENLLVGDHILVNKFIYGPVRWDWERLVLPQRTLRFGDVAVFRAPEEPGRDFIKRCVGLPGDELHIVDKELYRNGARLDESGYAQHVDPLVIPDSPFALERDRDQFGPFRVPSGNYFFLGDNRDRSSDSRFWGTVPADHFRGRAWFIYWSAARDEGGQQVRWRRSFRLVR